MPFTYKPLWVLLAEKEMSRTQLREEIKISPATLAKMGKNEYVAMEVLDKVCRHFNVQPNEVIQYVPGEENGNS
jgi:DNA-binding Xre family transcriptional regulator